MPRDGVEDRGDGLRLHQRRRAAAEEDRRHGAARRARGGRRDLGRESGHIARFVDRDMTDMAV